MSMWCDWKNKDGQQACFTRLWPSEWSGCTYKNEQKPYVTRDANGKVTKVRCLKHKDKKWRGDAMDPNDTQVLLPTQLWDETYWAEKEEAPKERTQTERLPRVE